MSMLSQCQHSLLGLFLFFLDSFMLLVSLSMSIALVLLSNPIFAFGIFNFSFGLINAPFGVC